MTSSLIPGGLYQLTDDTKIGGCIFRKGEVLTYTSGGYSPYDDCYVYHFMNALGEKRICMSPAKLTVIEMENFESVSRA